MGYLLVDTTLKCDTYPTQTSPVVAATFYVNVHWVWNSSQSAPQHTINSASTICGLIKRASNVHIHMLLSNAHTCSGLFTSFISCQLWNGICIIYSVQCTQCMWWYRIQTITLTYCIMHCTNRHLTLPYVLAHLLISILYYIYWFFFVDSATLLRYCLLSQASSIFRTHLL